MKLFKQVLKPETIDLILEEAQSSFTENVWCSSALSWTDGIRVGSLASAFCKPLSPSHRRRVLEEIHTTLPPHNKLFVDIYVWPPGACISEHDDSRHLWGATIYLNEDWHVNYGGIFLWFDEKTQEWKMKVPEYNTLMLNDEQERHLITPVTYATRYLRYTLQIFAAQET
jgi:hypothetical protein